MIDAPHPGRRAWLAVVIAMAPACSDNASAVDAPGAGPDAARPDACPAGVCEGDAPGGGYTTTFPGTENPIDEGGRWITGKADGLDWNDPMTEPGRAHASVMSGDPSRYNDSIGRLTTTFDADQYAEGVVYRETGYAPPGGHEVELLLRFSITPHDAHGYEVLWGATGYLAVVRWNGPLADYTPLYDPGLPGIGPAAPGDLLRAEIRGTTIDVAKNGVSVASVDLTAQGGAVWTDGQPGIGFWPVDGATIDAFGWSRFRAGGL